MIFRLVENFNYIFICTLFYNSTKWNLYCIFFPYGGKVKGNSFCLLFYSPLSGIYAIYFFIGYKSKVILYH